MVVEEVVVEEEEKEEEMEVMVVGSSYGPLDTWEWFLGELIDENELVTVGPTDGQEDTPIFTWTHLKPEF